MEKRSERNEREFVAPEKEAPPVTEEQASKAVATPQSAMTQPGPGRSPIGLLIALAFFSAIVGGLVLAYTLPYMYGSTPAAVFSGPQGQPAAGSGTTINVEGGGLTAASAVAEKLRPSVVNIDIRTGARGSGGSGLYGGVGTGVIYSQDGYIVTNNHVVSGARDIVVTIGTEEVPATLVAADPESDLAVIKVDKTGLPAAELGSTEELKVGAIAIAIGSPFGFQHSVTSGIISALDRNLTIPGSRSGTSVTLTNLIQTDAAVNPGNSGGALSDATGKIIGINTLIVSGSGTSEGVGFAIPVETVKDVADQLIKDGKASHPFIGIIGGTVSDVATEESGVNKGVIISEVVSGGPAARAGLRKGDIIVAVDGKDIEDMPDLISTIRDNKVGDKIEITYLRSGAENTVSLTLVEKPRQ